MKNKVYIHTYYFDENITYYAEVHFFYQNKLRRLIEFGSFRYEGKEKALNKAVKFCKAFGLKYEVKDIKEVKKELANIKCEEEERAEYVRLKEKYKEDKK